MEKGRTPDEDLALSSDLNTTGAPRSARGIISSLPESHSATLSSTSYSSATPHRHSRLPPPSSLSHPHFAQYHSRPSSTEHSHQHPATSSYLPSTSTSAPTNRPSPSSTSPMIVSALSFYDPAQASAIPDYHHLSRWDAPFDPSLSDNSLVSRDPAFLTATTAFGVHQASVPSDGSHLLPQQHRQIVPIPRRQRGLHQHDPTEREGRVQNHPLPSRQGLAQTEQHEQRSQVRHLYLRLLCLIRLFDPH
ncbi:hypothetical protein EV363DRAFT_275641 [Boletus edulis]|nr:hypothetical protein EV363DRAFT_275641 [Boletus edulis]